MSAAAVAAEPTRSSPRPPFSPIHERNYTLEDARKVADYLREHTAHAAPDIAIVLGSRLMGGFEQVVEDPDIILFTDIQEIVLPSFPTCSAAPGKEGAFIFGLVDGVSVLLMRGRFHMYEGHSSQATSFPVRVMKELGIQILILTNAARGLSPTLEIGDVMLVVDHYNTERGSESHPLAGVNIQTHGPRFLRCDNLYDPSLRRLTRRIAKHKHISLKQGGYIFVSGPSYETPMEEDGLRNLCEKRGKWGRMLMHLKYWTGATDATPGSFFNMMDRFLNKCGLHDTVVGMSTVPEVLVADHCGLRVVALSGIYFVTQENTLRITGGGEGLLSAKEVKKIEYEKRRRREEDNRQTQIAPKMISLLRGLVQALGDTSDIDMDFDVRDIARWRFPTQLCVSWHSVFLGVGAAAVALSFAVTAVGEQRRARR